MEIENQDCSTSSTSSEEEVPNKTNEEGQSSKKWQEPYYMSVKIPDDVDVSMMTKK